MSVVAGLDAGVWGTYNMMVLAVVACDDASRLACKNAAIGVVMAGTCTLAASMVASMTALLAASAVAR